MISFYMATLGKGLPRQLIRSLQPHARCSRMSSSVATAFSPKAVPKNPLISESTDFEEIQEKRPNFDHFKKIEVTKSPNPTWKYGQGVKGRDGRGEHREVDPYSEERPMINNYRLLIAGIAPRPVGFISTVSGDGKTQNLSPFSYFQLIDHDPPMFVVGFSPRSGREKDTYRNLKETGECVINTVSEDMIEAVNASSIDAPYGVSEWEISGLTQAHTTTVKAPRVQESVLSIEGKVVDIKEFKPHSEGKSIGGIVLIKASRFWVREDATNVDASDINLEVLRPVGQLGGMSYGRIVSTFEVPRKTWEKEYAKSELLTKLEESKPQV
ncbi:hypothetical protein F4805DRAFT_447308 [Annulohypoxylon moriforme]|nr:hypothetical protein F4805DRAFT_447308 [Annulohypoxylon moriforme]